MAKRTDEELVRDLVKAGAPDDVDPDIVAAAAADVAAASVKGPPSRKVIERIAEKYPQLRPGPSHPHLAASEARVHAHLELTARDVMHRSVKALEQDASLLVAAETMRALDMGSIPVVDAAGNLAGMISDRDIVVRGLGAGLDPTVATVGDIVQHIPPVDADAAVEDVLEVMGAYRVRRLPVVSQHELVGIVSEADIEASSAADAVDDALARD